MFLDHTQRRTTVGRTPLDERSARRRELYLTTHNNHNRQTFMPPGGIRTRDLSRLGAAELRIRPRGYWDRQIMNIMYYNISDCVNDFLLTKLCSVQKRYACFCLDKH